MCKQNFSGKNTFLFLGGNLLFGQIDTIMKTFLPNNDISLKCLFCAYNTDDDIHRKKKFFFAPEK